MPFSAETGTDEVDALGGAAKCSRASSSPCGSRRGSAWARSSPIRVVARIHSSAVIDLAMPADQRSMNWTNRGNAGGKQHSGQGERRERLDRVNPAVESVGCVSEVTPSNSVRRPEGAVMITATSRNSSAARVATPAVRLEHISAEDMSGSLGDTQPR